MFSPFAKALFVLTSLAPVLAAFAVKDLENGKSFLEIAPLLFITVALPFICWLLLLFAQKQLELKELAIVKVKSTDKEILAYLITYLLPLLTEDSIDYRTSPWVTTFVFGVIFLAVYHSNAFHFNPLLGFAGYHFYEIEAADGMAYLFITSKIITKQKMSSGVVQLADYIFLEVKDT